jgi:hypothetical protein
MREAYDEKTKDHEEPSNLSSDVEDDVDYDSQLPDDT